MADSDKQTLSTPVDKDINYVDLKQLAQKEQIRVQPGTSKRTLCALINKESLGIVPRTADKAKQAVCANFVASKQTLNGLVSQVIADDDSGRREFDLDALSMKNTGLEVTKSPDDATRPLKNVATDMVVAEFFSSQDTLYRFLYFVYSIFNHALYVYRQRRAIQPRDLFFLYKGGNILRLVSTEFLLELPANATRSVSEFYAPFFKRGDADFTIYMNPNLANYDTVFHEVTLLSYLLQDKIRSWFEVNLTRYFDFFRYNDEYRREIMQPYLAKFNEAEGFENMFVDFKIGDTAAVGERDFAYSANSDVTLAFVDPDEDWLLPIRQAVIAPIKQHCGTMTITHNNTLDFMGRTSAVRQRFNLTRTKFIFTLLQRDGQTRNVGGELIDVSISHRLDSKIEHFFQHLDQNVVLYHLNYDSECDLTFNAYTIRYLTFDLEDVLFVQKQYPWDDRKYVKRVNRLFYMYFVDIFLKLDSGAEKLRVLQDIDSMILMPLTEIQSDASDAQSLQSALQKFLHKYSAENLNINALVERLSELLGKIGPEHVAPFKTMIATLRKNVTFLIDTVQNIRQYCASDGKVVTKVLHEANVKNFV